MAKQLTIFDSMTQNIDGEIENLKAKIASERSCLETLDIDDYEDRNDIRSCNKMIKDYEDQIGSLLEKKAEYMSAAYQLGRGQR